MLSKMLMSSQTFVKYKVQGTCSVPMTKFQTFQQPFVNENLR